MVEFELFDDEQEETPEKAVCDSKGRLLFARYSECVELYRYDSFGAFRVLHKTNGDNICRFRYNADGVLYGTKTLKRKAV